VDTSLLDRVGSHGSPWLRYMLTLSEAAKTGESWVVATGDDIGLWDTDSGPVLPLWPDRSLAADAVSDAHANAAPIGIGELKERLLPFLIESDANVSLFPNFCEDMLVEPTAVAEDLEDFSNDSVDIAAELQGDVREAAYDEWALLESVEFEEEDDGEAGEAAETAPMAAETPAPVPAAPPASGVARYDAALAACARGGGLWLLDDAGEDAVVGVVLDDRPALALFASEDEASSFAASIDADAKPRLLTEPDLAAGWLLVAYGGHWLIALSPDGTTAAFAEPTRFALELAEACAAAS
jgi:hypothetical protein